jgi:hypothetical protein
MIEFSYPTPRNLGSSRRAEPLLTKRSSKTPTPWQTRGFSPVSGQLRDANVPA